MIELWVDKHLPKTIDEYVFQDETHRSVVEKYKQDKAIGHLLLCGRPGVGKTSLVKMLFNELGVDPSDIKFIPAGIESGIDVIREKIINFASTDPVGEYKYIFMDEADSLSPAAQRSLRNVMDTYQQHCRFIFTCNYKNKIIEPLHSRCKEIDIQVLGFNAFLARIVNILEKEHVPIVLTDESAPILMYVNQYYPDMRKCITEIQANVVNGELQTIPQNEAISDFRTEAVSLFKLKKYEQARKLICSQIRTDEFVDFFRFLYDNIDIFDFDNMSKLSAYIIIKNGLVNHAVVADPEINLAATLCELELLKGA